MVTGTTTTRKLAKKHDPIPPTPQPYWQSPRKPQPAYEITSSEARLTVLEQAQAIGGLNSPPEVLAAIIIAQAADRLGKALVEAAAVGRYRGS